MVVVVVVVVGGGAVAVAVGVGGGVVVVVVVAATRSKRILKQVNIRIRKTLKKLELIICKQSVRDGGISGVLPHTVTAG